MALHHVGRRPVPTQELAMLLHFETAVGMEVMVAALMIDRRFRFCKGEGWALDYSVCRRHGEAKVAKASGKLYCRSCQREAVRRYYSDPDRRERHREQSRRLMLALYHRRKAEAPPGVSSAARQGATITVP
jgi:hypothetical protein